MRRPQVPAEIQGVLRTGNKAILPLSSGASGSHRSGSLRNRHRSQASARGSSLRGGGRLAFCTLGWVHDLTRRKIIGASSDSAGLGHEFARPTSFATEFQRRKQFLDRCSARIKRIQRPRSSTGARRVLPLRNGLHPTRCGQVKSSAASFHDVPNEKDDK